MLNTLLNSSEGTAPPLLIIHGLFGSGRNWGVIAKRLSDRGSVVAVDLRNHGDSFWADSHSYHDMAADLAEVIEAQDTLMDVVGHSMGGKAAMVLALTRPELVSRLLVADIAPVTYTHSQLQIDLKNKRWKLNLDALASEMPKILGFPEVSGAFDKPTLFLTGATSDYVTPEHRPKIRSLFPRARFAKIPNAGHWLHADKPREFEASVRAFLDLT